jgi:hypothetical protein
VSFLGNDGVEFGVGAPAVFVGIWRPSPLIRTDSLGLKPAGILCSIFLCFPSVSLGREFNFRRERTEGKWRVNFAMQIRAFAPENFMGFYLIAA